MKETMTVWIPKGLNLTQIIDIIQGYGTNNDTISYEKYDANIVPHEITIEVKKINKQL